MVTSPLDFSLSTKGVSITGSTNDADELDAFIAKLARIAEFLRAAIEVGEWENDGE